MKRNKVLIIVIVFILIVLCLTVFYKNNSNKKFVTKKHYFENIEIKNFKKDDETIVNDKELYGEKVIQKPLYEKDYMFFNNNESITGKIYIGTDRKLYITDINKNLVYKVSDEKFKTLYVKNLNYKNGIYVYLISEDYKIYTMGLESNDITSTYIYDYKYGVKFENFVDIDLKHDMYVPSNSVFAITDEGKIYDVNSGLRYDERTISVYRNLYVYHDNTMTNEIGHLVEDKEGKRYKIKYLFEVTESDGFIKDKEAIIVITEDNKFIYFDSDMMHVYEFDKKVKDVKFDQYYPYISGKLEITFEDDYKVDLTARCNQYYCINKFAE